MPNGGENLDYGSDVSSEETDSSSTKEEITEEPLPEPPRPKSPPTPPGEEVESLSDSSDKRRKDKREPLRGRSPAPARGKSPAPARGRSPQAREPRSTDHKAASSKGSHKGGKRDEEWENCRYCWRKVRPNVSSRSQHEFWNINCLRWQFVAEGHP